MFRIIFLIIIILNFSFSSKQNSIQIQKIEFASKGCFGTCPVWSMIIENDKTSLLIAQKYNKESGSFKTTIDSESFNDIIQKIEKLQSIAPKAYYNSDRTCGIIHELKVYTDKGILQTKSMRLSGPKELQELFNALIEFREKAKWENLNIQ